MNDIEKYAELFQVLCENEQIEKPLGKKVTQKMFYFFERKGLDLNLRYGIHFYGPYSSKLDNIMHVLESENMISIDDSGRTHMISLGKEYTGTKVLSTSEMQIVNKVIEQFGNKNASELEALATMDYIANFTLHNKAIKDDIIAKFKEIKGSKFDDGTVSRTYNELLNMEFISAA